MRSKAASQTQRRDALARRIVERLAECTPLRASLLTGSVAQGSADQHSDIDLLNYYDTLPDRVRFRGLMAELGAGSEGRGHESDAGFSDDYRIEDVLVQTGASSLGRMEARVARVEAGDVDWISVKVAVGVLEGVPLYGARLVRGWQRRLAYPPALGRREVERNLGFFPLWEERGPDRDGELRGLPGIGDAAKTSARQVALDVAPSAPL